MWLVLMNITETMMTMTDDGDSGIDVMNVSVYFHSGLTLWRNSSNVVAIYMLLPVCSPRPQPGLQRKMTFWWTNLPVRGLASTKEHGSFLYWAQRGQSVQTYSIQGDEDEEEKGEAMLPSFKHNFF